MYRFKKKSLKKLDKLFTFAEKNESTDCKKINDRILNLQEEGIDIIEKQN